ncbi:MAG: hypothetical protein QG671_1053 [Actinomycetota bacterium]|nr:hypothetical protein [Actinomycetota bacterium]
MRYAGFCPLWTLSEIRGCLKLMAYDNGMIQLDGIPINASPEYDGVDGWLGAAEVAVTTINEFRRRAALRRQSITGAK